MTESAYYATDRHLSNRDGEDFQILNILGKK